LTIYARLPICTRFPYTTLFRSDLAQLVRAEAADQLLDLVRERLDALGHLVHAVLDVGHALGDLALRLGYGLLGPATQVADQAGHGLDVEIVDADVGVDRGTAGGERL